MILTPRATDTTGMKQDTTSTSPQVRPVRVDANIGIAPSDGFVKTPEVERIAQRAVAYLDAGYPVHLAGPAGTGKTTLAFHIASMRGRAVSLIHGNDAFNGTDLAGRDRGYKRSTTIDNYISSVLKTDENFDITWQDNRLTKACRLGHTLIYDEFNRTKAEANNILLGLLEEGIVSVPDGNSGYLRVHPEFRILLTSNPAEYAGTHRAPDALLDRLITIRCSHYDAQTETGIVSAASGLSDSDAAKIVRCVRALRGEDGEAQLPSIRSAIALARITSSSGSPIASDNDLFLDMAWDVLGEHVENIATGDEPVTAGEFRALIQELIEHSPATAQEAA